MMKIVPLPLVLLVCIASPTVQAAEDAFFLNGTETIVFFGDSITQAGLYIEYIDSFLLTRLPKMAFHIINRGISSETISGTSEADHEPRRPNAHDRFSRDVAAAKPDVIVACFGMNDGNYFPFETGNGLKDIRPA